MDHDADVQVFDQSAITEFPLSKPLFGSLTLRRLPAQVRVGRGQFLASAHGTIRSSWSWDCCRRCSEMRRLATTAANASPVSAYRFINTCRWNKDCCTASWWKGPHPAEVPPMAAPEKIAVARVTSGVQSQADPYQKEQGNVQEMLRHTLRKPAAEYGLTGQEHQDQQDCQLCPPQTEPCARFRWA